jgi:hypothetical protein
MANRPIKKIDLVPTWIRQAIADNAVPTAPAPATPAAPTTQGPREHGFKVVDPFAPGKGTESMIRRIKAEFFEDPESGTAVVQLGWEGTQPQVLEFYKKFASAKDADVVFSEMLKQLRQIESYVDTNPDKAKEKVTELFDEYKGQSDPMVSAPGEGTGSRSNSSLHTKIADGWEVINREGKLTVHFSDDFLATVFANYKEASATPVSSGEYVYSTSSRPHCGADNFVISYWRKAKTSDGNIIRNAAMISRLGGETFLVAGIPMEEYNTLCAALTPAPEHYGISYDSVTDQWVKVAAVVERYFSTTPEELDRILDYLGKGKKGPAEEAMPKKDKKEKEEKPKSDEEAKLDELLNESPENVDQSMPLAGEGGTEPMHGGDADKALEDLLK